MERNQELTQQQADDKMAAQMPLEIKERKADIVINNDGSLAQLEE